jgi:hypothetical protein
MRDLVAGFVALALVLAALLFAATLHVHRQRRERARRAARAQGRRIVAELPAGADLIFFTEDETHFYDDQRPIPKGSIRAVRLLVNGQIVSDAGGQRTEAGGRVPEAGRQGPEGTRQPASGLWPPASDTDALFRDRWDVAIETTEGTVLIACGAIRERISQELARAVYDAVTRAITTRSR